MPKLSNAEGGVLFDLAANGELIRVAWPVDESSGWLALDRNGNGVIDDGGELFGTATRLASGTCSTDGYRPLQELDANHDGILDESDPAFAQLRVWIDKIRNGQTDPGELVSLSDLRVLSLEVYPKASQKKDRWGNLFRYRAGVRSADGRVGRLSYDVFPGTAPAEP